MEGCAVADNHPAMIAEIERKTGHSYDLADHQAIVAGTDAFLDRWGFRKAFPTAEHLFLSIGRKCYESWQNYLENIRIGDSVDIACISGWESTAIENHSGIVDNLRHFKADPAAVRASLLPVRPIAKQRQLAYRRGESAVLDIYLLNDTGHPVTGTLTLELVAPDGAVTPVGSYQVPDQTPDRFSYLVAEAVRTPPLSGEGLHRIQLSLSGRPEATFEREIWVTGPAPQLPPGRRVAAAGIADTLRRQLATVPGLAIEAFQPGQRYDLIIASGLSTNEIARRQVGEQTGLEAQPKKGEEKHLVEGRLPDAVLEAARGGTPLLAIVPEDGLADGVSRQLAGLDLFRVDGSVGDLRAPWMGNWTYLRAHPLFEGIPADTAAGVLHQIDGQASNGLIVDGDGVEVVAGYSRDHDRRNGAASFIARHGAMRVVVHRMPDMAPPLQERFLANAVAWLSQPDRKDA
jgi:hypothetical protein